MSRPFRADPYASRPTRGGAPGWYVTPRWGWPLAGGGTHNRLCVAPGPSVTACQWGHTAGAQTRRAAIGTDDRPPLNGRSCLVRQAPQKKALLPPASQHGQAAEAEQE